MHLNCLSTTLLPYSHIDRVVEDYALTVSPNASVREAIFAMHCSKDITKNAESAAVQKAKIGYVLVTENLIPVGILTDTDVVRLLAADIDLKTVKVADVMQQVITLTRSWGQATPTPIRDCNYIIQQLEQFRFLVVVNKQGELDGIITEHSFITGLKETGATTEVGYNSLCYRDIVESQEELICRFLVEDTTLIFANQACYNYLHNQPEYPIAQSFMALILEEDRQGLKQELELLSVNNSTTTYISRIFEPNGGIGWLEWSFQSFFDANSNIIAYQAVGRNITLRRQNEEIFRQKQTQYRTIFETVNDGIFINDLETGTLVEANPVACRMHGYSHEELLSIPASVYVHPDSYHVFSEFIETVKAGRDFAGQAVGVRKDGSLFNVEIRGTTVFYNGGLYGLSAIRDITRSKQLELALQNSQAKLTDILNNSAASIVNFRLFVNRTWEYEYQSLGSEALFGYTADEIIANNTLWISRIFPPDLENTIMPIFDKLLLGGTYRVEYRFYYKDGSTRWISDTYTSRRDQVGNCWIVTGISTDITERKVAELRSKQLNFELEDRVQKRTIELATTIEKLNREIAEKTLAETQLRQSEARFRSLFDANIVGVIFANLSGEITDANDYFLQMLGYSREEMLAGLRWTDLTPPEYINTSIEVIERLRCQGLSPEYEKAYFHKDGTPIPILIAVGLLESGKDDVIAIIVNISDRKKAEAAFRQQIERELRLNKILMHTNAELARATRLKDEFIANMSHELRTPLNAILGLSEGLLDEVFASLTDKQKKAITTIQNSGKHLLDLINDILDLAKVESGNIELHPRFVSIKTLCDSSCTFLKQQASVKNIQICIEIACKEKEIWVDELRLRQVLINLLSNAVKFTPNGGKVSLVVDIDDENNKICFRVIDTGIGIDSKDINTLFQPFRQVDSSLSRSYSGTGLGLALVRKITEMHKGCVTVSSEVGKGSCFTVKLPRENQASLPTLQTSQKNMLLKPSNIAEQLETINIETCLTTEQPLILLAEDNQANTELLTEFLEYCGYRFAIARNRLEAVQLAFAEKPQLILMDIQMPKMDGLTAIAQIRAKPEVIQVPIIALTALAMPEDKYKCIEAGANKYITKPISLKNLSSLIKKLLKYNT